MGDFLAFAAVCDGVTMTSRWAFLLLFAALGWQPAAAVPIYKWVDDAGRVTYSSLPPPAGVRAEKVEPPPQPAVDDVRQAEERTERARALARELEAERLREEAEAAEAARLRALQFPPPPIVIEKPVYVPQPVYYPPVRKRPPKRPGPDDKPTRRPLRPPVSVPAAPVR